MLYNISVVVNSNNSWLDVVTLSLDYIATVENLASLLFDILNAFPKCIYCVLSMKRPKQGLRIQWVSSFDSFVCTNHSIYKFVVDFFMQEYSSHCSASLTSSTYTSEHTRLQSQLLVCVFHNDSSIVASQFKNSSSESFGYLSGYLSSYSSRSSEAN